MSEVTFQRLIGAAEIPEGQMRAVQIAARSILLCRTKEGWFALDDVCTHANAKMHEGRLRGNRLICPLHGASFDCRTGAVLGAPAIQPLKTYPVRRVGDDIEIGVT
jgi:3-phenylpropionate/trans-cinnamate dioxygenase ferredoxin subunit